MILHEADLFKGMSQEVIKEIDSVMIEESYEGGAVLFREGDPAINFYILGDGKVKLTIGEEGYMTHVVSNPGEVFGWSSLVEDGFYTASAQCSLPTKVLRIEREELNKVFESHPLSGMSFFKRLAGVVGKRLVTSYRSLLSAHKEVGPSTYGISEEPDPG
ncbi:MAG: cyclic nucleotide-binding domain-containing protein [Deltaproteobacteria bacterium]|jgi:CRP-like cAMP-binding protein